MTMQTKLFYFTVVMTAALITSCGGKKEEKADATETMAEEISYTVDPASSTVSWTGEVMGVYGHNGVIDLAEGQITAKGDSITGGKIVIDMTSIVPLDSASFKDEEGSRASDLVGHLSTGDFFLVEEHPTSSFVIKSHDGSDLTGDLTIRGITKEVTATLNSLEANAEGLTGSADLVFNRQDFEVSWVHFMKDMVLSDDIKIKLDIQAKP